jgi:hypothetical protein
MQEAKDREADILALHVAVYNSAACKLYQRLGFHRLRKHLKFYRLNGDRAPGPRGQTTFDGYLYALSLVDTGAEGARGLQSGGVLLQSLAGACEAICTVFQGWYCNLQAWYRGLMKSHSVGLPVAAQRLELLAASPDCTLACDLLAPGGTGRSTSRQQLAVKVDPHGRPSRDAGIEVIKLWHPLTRVITERLDPSAADSKSQHAIETERDAGANVLPVSREGVSVVQDGMSNACHDSTVVTESLWARPSSNGRTETPVQAAEKACHDSTVVTGAFWARPSTSGGTETPAQAAEKASPVGFQADQVSTGIPGWQPPQPAGAISRSCREGLSNCEAQALEHDQVCDSARSVQRTFQGDGICSQSSFTSSVEEPKGGFSQGDRSRVCLTGVQESNGVGSQGASSSVWLTGVQESWPGGVREPCEGRQSSVCEVPKPPWRDSESDRLDGSPWDGRMAMYRWLFGSAVNQEGAFE